jgi:hypothetical protein
MLKALKLKRLAETIQEKQQLLAGQVSHTEEVKLEAFRRVIAVKREGEMSWAQTMRQPVVRSELFQLLLHRQFIGQLAEDVRQLTFRYCKVSGRIESAFDRAKYHELIENCAAKPEMEELMRQFAIEMLPLLREHEQNDA